MGFIAIDFETANDDPESACQIGLAYVEDGKVIGTHSALIRPPSQHFYYTYIHKITWEHVKDSPAFPDAWAAISDRIQGNLLVAHNARFDMNVLNGCIRHYRMKVPVFDYACTLKMARKSFEGLGSYSLSNLCQALDIRPGRHDAAEDARAAAELLLLAMNKANYKDASEFLFSLKIPPKEFGGMSVLKMKENAKHIPKYAGNACNTDLNWFDGHIDFSGKTFVMTGESEYATRMEIAKLVESEGGIVVKNPTKKTDYVVVGGCGSENWTNVNYGTKLEKALLLQSKGSEIKIVSDYALFTSFA